MTAMTTEVLGLPRGRALTRRDLDSMPDDGHRYELLDGVLVVSPAPRFRHQDAVGSLFKALDAAAPEELKVLFAPFDVLLSEDTVIQPDLIVAPRESFTDRDLPGPPLLAVEVLSPSTRGIDLMLKKERLQRAGCPHYWVVDPDEPSITAWTLADGAYVEMARATGEATFDVADPLAVRLTPVSLID